MHADVYIQPKLLKILWRNYFSPDLFLFLFQELEFSNLFAVLHCIHSFFAAKVACLDPLFLGNQAATSAAVSSASTSKAKHMAWHAELFLTAFKVTHSLFLPWKDHAVIKATMESDCNSSSRKVRGHLQMTLGRQSNLFVLPWSLSGYSFHHVWWQRNDWLI